MTPPPVTDADTDAASEKRQDRSARITVTVFPLIMFGAFGIDDGFLHDARPHRLPAADSVAGRRLHASAGRVDGPVDRAAA